MRTRRRPGRLTRRGAILGVLVLGLAGCMTPQDDAAPAAPGGAADPTEEVPVTDVPVLQVRQTGGFVLAGTDFRAVPQLTVYADGRAVSNGPQIAIHPPPALPNLRAHELSEESVDAVVAAAREAGLLDGAPDYGQPPLADVPTTVVELHVDGETVRHEVQAFGFEELPEEIALPEGTDEDTPGLPGLTEEQRAARAALTEVLASVDELLAADDGEKYDVTAFALLARPAEAGTTENGLDADTVPWPLPGVALADLGECVVVQGDEAAALGQELAGASDMTRFEQDGDLYEVWPRPLLPHEESCEDLPGPATAR